MPTDQTIPNIKNLHLLHLDDPSGRTYETSFGPSMTEISPLAMNSAIP
jgi:hypothetical protein